MAFESQLTEFEGGGLAVGLSCTNLLADPICAAMFIQAWADTNSAGKLLNPPYFHSLPLRRPGNRKINHKPYTQLINHYKSCIHLEAKSPAKASNYATVSLAFPDDMVRACMTNAAKGWPCAASPFEALAALFWVCISNAKGVKEGLVDMSICLDVRKVLGLDKGFFGNCMVYGKVCGEEGLLEKRELPECSIAIGEVVRKMDIEGVMDLIEWLHGRSELGQSALSFKNNDDLICVNLDTMDPFSAVFEGGFGPMQVSYYVEPNWGEGQVVIFPWESTEGPLSRVVMVTLPEDEIAKLFEDALILQFSPTVLMGVHKFKH